MPIQPYNLILASTSPYRRELLARLRLPFQTISPNVDETPLHGEKTAETALRLAIAKAQAHRNDFPQSFIIGSDQVAELSGKILHKPLTHDVALKQLQSMQGKTVQFHTAIAVLNTDTQQMQHHVESSTVYYRTLPETLLDQYLRVEKPYQCAGSAKIEGLGITLVEKVESQDPTAIIGLPLIALCNMLRKFGFEPIA